MALTYLQLATKILEEEKRPLSYTEIWSVAVNKGYDKLVGTTGKTPWDSIGALLYVDVRDNPNSIFMAIGSRPKRFILKSQYHEIKDSVPPFTSGRDTPIVAKLKYIEKDLHPLMVYHGFYYMKAYLQTIKHTSSTKKSYGEWVHPDIVGCSFPFPDWDPDVVEVSSLLGASTIKLFSFELKKELSFNNLRESFFQAVSNSSWANEGYLVAAEIERDDEFMSELGRLSSAFGIGIIYLNIDDPDSCETILPARIKDTIDWDTVNKLAIMNPDFMTFLRRIKVDMASREVRKEKYDAVMDKSTLIASFKQK